MINIGANDLFWMQTQQANLSPQQLYETYMKPFAATLATSVATLQADGARTIVVLNLNEYARLVAGERTALHRRSSSVSTSPRHTERRSGPALAAAGVNFVPADISSLFTYVSQNPTKFGFTAASVLASNPACGSTSSLVCSPGQLVAPDAEQTHLWADGRSPDHGGAGHRVGLHLQPADRAEPGLAAGGKRRAGRVGAHGNHPAADRSVRTTSWSERRQRLDQRRGQQPEHERRSELPHGFRHPVRRHGGSGLSAPGRGDRGRGSHRGRPDPKLLHGRPLQSVRRGAEPVCRLLRGADLGQRDRELRPAAEPRQRARSRSACSPTRTAPTPTGIRWRWRCAAATISRLVRSPPALWRERSCSRCASTASPRPVPAASPPSRSAARHVAPRSANSAGEARSTWEIGSPSPSWRGTTSGPTRTARSSRRSRRSRHRPGPPPRHRSPPTGPTASLGASYKLSSQVIIRGTASAFFANPQASGYGGELSLNVAF